MPATGMVVAPQAIVDDEPYALAHPLPESYVDGKSV